MAIIRIKEKEIISKAILARKSLFVYGQEGVGKTYLVKNIVEDLKDKSVLYSSNCATLKNTLLGLLSYEYSLSSLRQKNILSLKKLFYKLIKREKPYFVFDHLNRVGPKFCAFFEYLMDFEIPFLGVSRGITHKDIGYLSLFLCNIKKLNVINLTKNDTAHLVKHFLMSQQTGVVLPSEFAYQIFHVSNGNPKIIKQMCLLTGESKYQKDKTCLNVKLMDLDRRIKGLFSEEI